MPLVGQRKSSLNKESGVEFSSPSKSPDHYHRTDTLRQPLADNLEHLSQDRDPSVRSPLPTDHISDHHHQRMSGEVHHDRPKHTRHHHHRHSAVTWGDKDKVVFLVDGKRFTFPPALLIKQPNTMLGRYVVVDVAVNEAL